MAFSKAGPHMGNIKRVSKKLSLHEWLNDRTSKKHINISKREIWRISTTVVFNVFGTRDQFHEDNFSTDWKGMVSEWLKCVTFIVYFNSIIMTPVLPQTIRHKIPEVADPYKKVQEWDPGYPLGPVVKNLPHNAGDAGSIPGLGRFHKPQGY